MQLCSLTWVIMHCASHCKRQSLNWSVMGGGAVIWLAKVHTSKSILLKYLVSQKTRERARTCSMLASERACHQLSWTNYQEQLSEGQKLKLNSLVSSREVTLTACCPVISKCWYFLAFDSEPLKLFISKFKRCRYYFYSKCFKCTNIIKYQLECYILWNIYLYLNFKLQNMYRKK